jgi:peptide/nickel transport system substrate-binding protein
MMRIRAGRTVRAATLFVALAFTAAACGGDDPEQDKSGADGGKQTLVVSLDTDVNLIEPHTFRTTAAYSVTEALYAAPLTEVFEDQDGLLVGTGEVAGELVEDFEISEDKKEVTLTIAQDAAFDNGDPVTADDLAWTFRRTIEGPGYIGALLPFIGISSADQLEVVDERTLVIRPSIASPLLERFLTFQVFGAMDESVAKEEATADDPWAMKYFTNNATASGAYKLVKFEPGRETVLEPNPGYPLADEVQNAGVTVRNVPDPDQRALLLERGELDLAMGIPPRRLQQLESNESLRIYQAPSSRLNYLGLNNKIAPFDNVDVRRAVAAAVPYQALIDQVMFGYASPAGSVVPSQMDTHAGDEVGVYETDLEEAKRLIAESGVDIPTIEFAVRQSRADDQQAAVFIQDSLREVGIKVNVVRLPDAEFSERLNAKELQMFIHDWYSWGEDPFYQMQFLMTSEAFTNFSQYSNPELDELVKAGTFELDAAKRAELSKQAQEILFADTPVVPLYSPDWVVATAADVTGAAVGFTQVVNLESLKKG